MASLNLLPRKSFEILLDDGLTVRGQYSTWSLNRYCMKKGLSLAQLEGKMSQDKLELDDLFTLILCAVEYTSRKEKHGFGYSDIDVADWVEELGGIASPNFALLVAHSSSEIKANEETEEKKSQLSSTT